MVYVAKVVLVHTIIFKLTSACNLFPGFRMLIFGDLQLDFLVQKKPNLPGGGFLEVAVCWVSRGLAFLRFVGSWGWLMLLFLFFCIY